MYNTPMIGKASETAGRNTVKTYTFEMNGRAYRTDWETLEVLASVVKAYEVTVGKQMPDASAVTAMMALGIKTGIIEDITDQRAS